MSKKLNIVFGKIGKSLSFRQGKWGMVGGDHEAPALLSMLAQMNPNINFHIISKSDWHDLTAAEKALHNVNENIFDTWEKWDTKAGVEVTTWPLQVLKNVKIDFGIIVSGPTGFSTIPNAMMTLDNDRVAKPSMMSERYVGPITRFLNESKIKYMEIGEDPRYFPIAARDLFNRPAYICGTRDLNQHRSVEIIDGYFGKVKEINLPVRDCRVSHMFMAMEPGEKRLKEPGVRKNLMSIYSNGLRNQGGMQKFPAIRQYVMDQFPDATIFGEWPEDTAGITPYLGRIKPTPMIELIDQMYDTKYAFMIPIQEGWPTSKFFKHLLFGIIPFFHPTCYPEYYQGVPEYLKLKSARDLKEKIDFLESNPKEYLKLWKQCQSMLEDEYFDGSYFNDIILDEICAHTGENAIDWTTKPIVHKMSCLWPNEEEVIARSSESRNDLSAFF